MDCAVNLGSAGASSVALAVTGTGSSDDVPDERSPKALSMKDPRTGDGVTRRGGRGPRHGPIRGGDLDSRSPDSEEHALLRHRRDEATGSTTDSSLQGNETLERSPASDVDSRSQKRLAGVGNPASIQNCCRSSSSERWER